MRSFLFLSLLLIGTGCVHAAEKDSTLLYDLPDSVKATAFITDVSISSSGIKREMNAGIRTSEVSLTLEADKKEREVAFTFPASAKVITKGLKVETEKDELEWKYEWKPNTAYKLLIATAADSAGNFILYSGYIFLPEENKWKLIGTCRVDGQWSSIKSPASFYSVNKKSDIIPAFFNTWIQRSNGSWKRLSSDEPATRPLINPMPSFDSVQQYQLEKAMLEKEISSGKADVPGTIEGVYYKIIEPGNGKSIAVTDTVTAYYKLRIYGTTEVISEASDKPATFPLNVLIKAWQLTLPLVKTGGKIRIVIPSGFGYSIRTRAPKIPPNSILDFEIQVVDAKPAIR